MQQCFNNLLKNIYIILMKIKPQIYYLIYLVGGKVKILDFL